MPKSVCAVALLWLSLFPSIAQAQQAGQDVSAQLFARINHWRVANGLPPVAYSPALSQVAQMHVADLEESRPGGVCSIHSWSRVPVPGGSSCPCYDVSRAAGGDSAMERCMWRKPAEISRGKYRDDGFEIAVQIDDYGYGRGYGMTPAMALQTWLGSTQHRAILANRGPWSRDAWKAMGVAVSQHYAVAWFGRTPDDGASRPQAARQTRVPAAASPAATQVTIHDASGNVFHTSAGQ